MTDDPQAGKTSEQEHLAPSVDAPQSDIPKVAEKSSAEPKASVLGEGEPSATPPAAPKEAAPAEGEPSATPTTPKAAAPAEGESPAPPATPTPTDAAPAPAEGDANAEPPAKTVAAKPVVKKKAPPPPDPRVEAAQEQALRIQETLVASLGAVAVEEVGAAHDKPMLLINRSHWVQTVDLLRHHEDWQLNYLELMAGTDYPDYIEVVVYIQSTALGHFVCLKTRTPREDAEVPSLVEVHPGVNWEEREIYDLLGVRFTNHPDLRRIMMWDEYVGHPLRKDFNVWAGEEDSDVVD